MVTEHFFKKFIFSVILPYFFPIHVLFCEFWEIFKNTFFTEHRRATASVTLMTLFKHNEYSILKLEIATG